MDLIGFKKAVKPLVSITEGYSKIWQEELFISISVLIQNICFDGRNCTGYDEDKEIEKIEFLISLLRKISEYNNHHSVSWIVSEIETVWMGYSYDC